MLYSVGELFDPDLTSWQEGMHYVYANDQHFITIAFPRLTIPEVAAIDHGPLQFALYAEDDQIILFMKLGAASGWLEMPFTIWRVSPDSRTIPEVAEPGEHATIMILMIAAENGRIAAMRFLTISVEMTAALYAGMRRQMSQPFDAQAYEQRITALRERYLTPDEFVADGQVVRIRCDGGD
jgi:hypothetical protein